MFPHVMLFMFHYTQIVKVDSVRGTVGTTPNELSQTAVDIWDSIRW